LLFDLSNFSEPPNFRPSRPRLHKRQSENTWLQDPAAQNRARAQQQDLSVQSELALNEVELLRRYEPTMGNTHTVERPIEITDPVVQEVPELRKLRRQVVILPDVALQQSWVACQSIQDFCRG